MALIIGDIHGSLRKAEIFLCYRPNERHICLGDLVDSRPLVTLAEELRCLNLLMDSATDFVWGNHDLSYLPEQPWECFGAFGCQPFRDIYNGNRSRFSAAIAADSWLLTHAGVSQSLGKIIPPGARNSAQDIADWLNNEFLRQLQTPHPRHLGRYGAGPLFHRAFCRGGEDAYGGIFWFDGSAEQSQPSPLAGPQIFGHSPVLLPQRSHSWTIKEGTVFQGPPWINLNAFQEGVWVYDTVADDLIDLCRL
ncbi:metallophosphoesterase family protein [Geomonas oryzae]|uniref:metallophosphoesterase family protein n=1 Tax=Geomonas oryzae TaxID=2364273 RepID=UPI00100B67AB